MKKSDKKGETALLREHAEQQFAEELSELAKVDDRQRPPNWRLSPWAVAIYILGGKLDSGFEVAPKYIGQRRLVEIAIATLATDRALLLLGVPGTAKTWLGEHLAAAISGDSTLTIQGSAGTTEDGIKYTWNYARLLAEGPTEGALVAAPLYTGMRAGKIVRFEEITRCPIEIQDCLLSVLSDRVLHIAELKNDAANVYALHGFNIIATANTLDRGVNEMSAALKRRFNFETVPAIADINLEIELVQRETDRMLGRAGIPVTLPPDKTELLVTMFHELRSGKTTGGKALEPLTTVMSTAEGVSVGYAAGIHAYYYGGGKVEAAHLVKNMIGSALKDSAEDLKKLRHYFNHVVKDRKSAGWAELYEARQVLDE